MKYPVYQPFVDTLEKAYVNECLDSGWISSKGRFVSLFENDFSKFSGIEHCVAVSNGTVALHLALLSLGIGLNDEVLVPTFTYIASVNSIKYCNATPVFIDCDAQNWQLDLDLVRKAITPRTKAIMAVHIYGSTCDLSELRALCDEFGLCLIEDCAEALGSKFLSQHVGNYGDVATFSFFGNKTITTGEGGMVCTNNLDIYQRLVKLKGQGLADNREYWHDIVGYNYRMTNIQAAIGVAQLGRVCDILKEKSRVHELYLKYLKNNHDVFFQLDLPQTTSSYWLTTILLREGVDREKLRERLKINGVETRPAFFPVHTMPIYDGSIGDYPISENIASRGVSLPSYPELTENDIKYICEIIVDFCSNV